MRTAQLADFFKPHSIAVVGVSHQTNKLGSVIYHNLIKHGFKGQVYPVNPKYPRLFNVTCYPTVSAVPAKVDMVIVVVPSTMVHDVLKDAATKKIKSAIVITAGFKETGPDGAKMEQALHDLAVENNFLLLGPNCLGMIIPHAHLDASFALQSPTVGSVAILSQSGAFGTAILDMAVNRNLGIHSFVSLGNKAGITELDLLATWLQDPTVKVIGAYLEDFVDGNDFIKIINSNPRKPIVLLRPGETEAGQKAVSSHTGSLAGSTLTIKTALQQSGVIQVNSLQEMIGTLQVMSWCEPPKGNKVAIVTNAGGPSIMLTDQLVKLGFSIAQLSQATKDQLATYLPKSASLHNPIDILGDALADRYEVALDAVVADPNVDIIMTLLTPQYMTQVEETSKAIITAAATTNKPLIPIFIGEKHVKAGIERLHDNMLPAFTTDATAVEAVRNLLKYSQFSTTQQQPAVGGAPEVSSPEQAKHRTEVKAYVTKETKALPQEIAQKLAKEVGIDTPREKIVNSVHEATQFAEEVGYPVVIKARTEEIAHKTDVKALFLNLHTGQELADAVQTLQNNIEQASQVKTAPFLIQEQVHGEELLIGTQRDGTSNVYAEQGKGFGHLLVFGKGGIYTEIYKDIAACLVPATQQELVAMMAQTKVSLILQGARGKDPLAIMPLLDLLESVQKLVQLYPEIESLDINPVMITKERCIAVDVKIFLKE